ALPIDDAGHGDTGPGVRLDRAGEEVDAPGRRSGIRVEDVDTPTALRRGEGEVDTCAVAEVAAGVDHHRPRSEPSDQLGSAVRGRVVDDDDGGRSRSLECRWKG